MLAINMFLMRYGIKRGFFIDENKIIKKISKTVRYYSKNLLFSRPFHIRFIEYKIKGNKKPSWLVGIVKYKDDKFVLPSPKKFNTKQRIRLVGEFLGYPKCCIKKFIEDFDYDSIYSKQEYIPSYYSGKRFMKQLKFHTNYFGIKMDNGTVFSPILDYVPCHPKCENSLKLLNFIKHHCQFFQNIAEEINKLKLSQKEHKLLCNQWHKGDSIIVM